jgi:hypothetical protein
VVSEDPGGELLNPCVLEQSTGQTQIAKQEQNVTERERKQAWWLWLDGTEALTFVQRQFISCKGKGWRGRIWAVSAGWNRMIDRCD